MAENRRRSATVAPADERVSEAGDGRVRVEEGHHRVADVVGRQPEHLRELAAVRREATVPHPHGLGRAGRTRREDQHERVGRAGTGVRQRCTRVRRERVGPGRVVDHMEAVAIHRLARGEEELEVRRLGEHERAVGVRDVAGQLRPPAGGVDADDGRPRQRRAAQREEELGDVVEQHADVEGRAGRRVRPEERSPLRGGVDDLAPGPRGVLEAQPDVVVGGAGAHEICDGLHRPILPARQSPPTVVGLFSA